MEQQENPTNDSSATNPTHTNTNDDNQSSSKLVLSMTPNASSNDDNSDDDDNDDDDQLACPICFQHEQLIVAPCQHVFCRPCLERILLSSGCAASTTSPSRAMEEFVSPEYPAGRDEDLEQLKIPAWGSCPICRQSLFLWDLKHCQYPIRNESSSSNEKGVVGKECKLPENEQVDNNNNNNASIPTSFTTGDYVYSRQAPDFGSIHFLKSSVWLEASSSNGGSATAAGQVGYGSFHFPPHHENRETINTEEEESSKAALSTTTTTTDKAYYNLENVSHKRLWLEDCLYHDTSRVLSARLVPDDDEVMSSEESSLSSSVYRLILAFSADGSFVRSGALVVQQPALTPSRHMEQFPYDGIYEFQEEKLIVVGHKCIMNGQPLLLQKVFEVDEDYSESFGEDDDDLFPVSLLKLVTPNRRVVGTTTCTTGVGVGAQLVWNIKTSITGTRRTWKWHRLAGPSAVTDRLPRRKIHRWGGPYAHRWLKRQGPLPVEQGSAMTSIPTFHSDSIWGNVFCQGFKVGLASYHFCPPVSGQEMGSAYISYENPTTSDWPPLDSGQPIPAKVYFHNISFPTPTTFRGDILWLQDYGTPWQGMIRWSYEMIFDAHFTCIVGGAVTSFDVHSPDVPRELSRYGESLVYVNAALYREFRRLVTAEDEEARQLQQQEPQHELRDEQGGGENDDSHRINTVDHYRDWSDRFRSRSLELRLRLQHENAGVRTIAMVHRLLTIAYQGEEAEECPIDYNSIAQHRHNENTQQQEELFTPPPPPQQQQESS